MYNTSVTVELCIDLDYSATPLFRTPLGQLQVSWLKEVSSFQGCPYTLFYVAGTMHGVLIKGGVLISGHDVKNYCTSLQCFWSARYPWMTLMTAHSWVWRRKGLKYVFQEKYWKESKIPSGWLLSSSGMSQGCYRRGWRKMTMTTSMYIVG